MMSYGSFLIRSSYPRKYVNTAPNCIWTF